MGFSFDVNILLFTVDAKSPFHKPSQALLRELLSGEDRCFLCWEVLHAYLRLASSPRIFETPLPLDALIANAEFFLSHPNVETLAASSHSMQILETLIRDFHLRGPIISDAVIASILEANGIRRIYTNDRDFWKFPFLKPADPFAPRA